MAVVAAGPLVAKVEKEQAVAEKYTYSHTTAAVVMVVLPLQYFVGRFVLLREPRSALQSRRE